MAIVIEPWPGQLTSIQTHDLRWEANHHGKIAGCKGVRAAKGSGCKGVTS